MINLSNWSIRLISNFCAFSTCVLCKYLQHISYFLGVFSCALVCTPQRNGATLVFFFFLWDWELLLRWNLSLCQTLSNWCMQKNDQKLKMWDHDLQLELAMIRPRVRRLHNFEWKTCFSCLAFKYLNNDSDDGSHFSFTVMVRVSQWSTLDFDWWIFINFFFKITFSKYFCSKPFLVHWTSYNVCKLET